MEDVTPCELPYGKGRLLVSVPGDRLAPREADPIADETRAVIEALENPIGTLPLRQVAHTGERVAIVVNDITRLTRTDLMLPPIVDTLNAAGIPDADIFIVFALGIHRRQTDEERQFDSRLGEEMYRRIRCFDTAITADDASLVEIGTTSFGNRDGDPIRKFLRRIASSSPARLFTISSRATRAAGRV